MSVIINLFKEVGPKAIEHDKGEQIGEMISNNIKNGQKVIVDFDGITNILSLFLNPAIGDLYGKFEPDVIKENLQVKNVPEEYLDTLKNVIDRAKSYYAESEKRTAEINEVIGNE